MRPTTIGSWSAATALACLLAIPVASWSQEKPTSPELSADQKAALDRISADSMRGHLSFLASDLLEGRNTPSRGLDIAAEYIAAQYRRAGLEPVGDDGYFQTATWQVAEPDPATFSVEFRLAGETITVPRERLSFSRNGKLDLRNLSLVKVDPRDPKSLAGLKTEDIEGRAIVIDFGDSSKNHPASGGPASPNPRAILGRLGSLKPALVIAVDHDPNGGTGLGSGRLIDPEATRGFSFPRPNAIGLPLLTIHDPKAVALLEVLHGPVEATVSLRLGEPVTRPVKLRNVIGLLRGSDPKLKDTYVLVTAHYDHVGIGSPVNGDKIYNGANDDGSGTVSVVELASALGSLHDRPKRSLVFLTFFGEEHGLLGSRYYGKHPVFPIDRTVADVNLEQVGRTDSSEGPQVANASLTGFDFSDVGTIFRQAGESEGVKIYKHPRNSDAYFGASDNQALADLGVPAHTLCVAFAYPDYHGAADHWDKLDYANMAKVDRVVGRALLMIANNPEPPKWDDANPRAKRYKKAHDDRKPKEPGPAAPAG